jgi:hypothetical protein
MEDIRQLSVSDLIKRLHESVASFVSGMENVISMNKQEPPEEISELRGHLMDRLKKGEEITDNRKLISFLDMLSKDQAVLELVREDAKDWLEILDTIEGQMSSRKPLTAAETSEIKRIRQMSGELKALIRSER